MSDFSGDKFFDPLVTKYHRALIEKYDDVNKLQRYLDGALLEARKLVKKRLKALGQSERLLKDMLISIEKYDSFVGIKIGLLFFDGQLELIIEIFKNRIEQLKGKDGN